MAKQHRSPRPVEVRKWAVTFHWADGHDDSVDGFACKQEAKAYKAKAADIIALQVGQGR